MQKKIIALAVAGLAATGAYAQSNVTIYGVADVSFETAKAEGATNFSQTAATNTAQNMTSRQRMTSNSSYVGFKGAEDLGNGLKALFQIETQIALDNANNATNGAGGDRLANRDTFVGLTSGFGTVLAGYISTPHRSLAAGWDVMPGGTGVGGFNNLLGKINTGTSLRDDGNTRNTFASNTNTIFRSQAVAYVTPTFSGLSGIAAYIPNEGKLVNTMATPAAGANTYEQNSSAWNVGANYANGPFKAGYSYVVQKDPLGIAPGGIFVNNTGGKLKSHLLAGSATFGDFTVGLAYNQNKINLDTFANNAGNNGATDIKNTVWAVNAKYVLGANEFAAQYQRANDGSVATINSVGVANAVNANDRGAKAYSLRYGYNFSKRTQAYVVYSEIKNDKNGNYDFGAGTGVTSQQAGISAGADPKVLGVGLRHSF